MPKNEKETTEAMPDYGTTDFFLGPDLVENPYPYFEYLRGQCPVHRESQHGVVMVTGFEEAVEIQNDAERYSSCNSVAGPLFPFPVPLEGHDVSALIEAHRYELPFSDMLLCLDPPEHTAHRGLLMRLITPKRLRENEAYMRQVAERQIDTFIDKGGCDFIRDFATPFTLLIIADLIGVPPEDRDGFLEGMSQPTGGGVGSTTGEAMGANPLAWLYEKFATYVEDRRRNPQDDVLTGLATATFKDGSLPEVMDVVRIAAIIFAAGHESSTRFLSSAFRILAEEPEVQARLRAEPGLIPNFIEETLRMESVVKGDFRLARVPTEVGGTEIPAGSHVFLLHGAANRDPRKFEDPSEFQLERPNARQHLAFGRGVHTCPGAPLVRSEAAVAIEQLLARTSDIRFSEEIHGPAGARRFNYVPSFVLRGLTGLTLEFDPRGAAA
ncbi:cytochrome P450 [Pseudofrankia sp. BMG5.36]|uniref:cytochrome P450 n=1 Tax=Pseudofrankia sp. BMG5.36 TaxID=1834512 RepID=UPI0009F6CD6A|nr:cytochrome P450 [Pseudofrankia sp. BMG5.36]